MSGAALEEGEEALLLHLDGFEGPLDLLLALARAQKIDLARISILQLVEQYLAVVHSARKIRLELAADWLVMAAWLTWLKSRLLLPDESGEPDPEGSQAADLLQARLAELARIGQVAAWLDQRPQLGRDVFNRGAEEDLTEVDRSGLALDMTRLLGAYMTLMRRQARKRRVYRPRQFQFWTVREALDRIYRLMGTHDVPGWVALEDIIPPNLAGLAERPGRAARAGAFIAGLELARDGVLELDQTEGFGQIMFRIHKGPGEREAHDTGGP